MKNKQEKGLWLIVAFSLVLLLLPLVHAAATDAVAKNTQNVFQKFLNWYATDSKGNFTGYSTERKILDFMLFFVLFTAITTLGFSKAFSGFEKGARPIKALSVIVGFMLALSLVSFTNVSIALFFPFAKNLLFLLAWGMIFFLFKQMGMKGIWAALLAIPVTYLLFHAGSFLICEFNDKNCGFKVTWDRAFKPSTQGKSLDLGVGKSTTPWKPSTNTDKNVYGLISCNGAYQEFYLTGSVKSFNYPFATGPCTYAAWGGKSVVKCAIVINGNRAEGPCVGTRYVRSSEGPYTSGAVTFIGMGLTNVVLSSITVTVAAPAPPPTEPGKQPGTQPGATVTFSEKTKKGLSTLQKVGIFGGGGLIGVVALLFLVMGIKKRRQKKPTRVVETEKNVLEQILQLVDGKITKARELREPLEHRKDATPEERLRIANLLHDLMGLVKTNDGKIHKLLTKLTEEILQKEETDIRTVQTHSEAARPETRANEEAKAALQESKLKQAKDADATRELNNRQRELIADFEKELGRDTKYLDEKLPILQGYINSKGLSDNDVDVVAEFDHVLDTMSHQQRELVMQLMKLRDQKSPLVAQWEDLAAQIAEGEKLLEKDREKFRELLDLRTVARQNFATTKDADAFFRKFEGEFKRLKLYKDEEKNLYATFNHDLKDKTIPSPFPQADVTFKITGLFGDEVHMVMQREARDIESEIVPKDLRGPMIGVEKYLLKEIEAMRGKCRQKLLASNGAARSEIENTGLLTRVEIGRLLKHPLGDERDFKILENRLSVEKFQKIIEKRPLSIYVQLFAPLLLEMKRAAGTDPMRTEPYQRATHNFIDVARRKGYDEHKIKEEIKKYGEL